MWVLTISANAMDLDWEWQNPLPQGNTLNDIWVHSDTDIFAVGESGEILHYDGSRWTEMTSGASESLHAVWGDSPADVYAVGDNGTILHYDGAAWVKASCPSNDETCYWDDEAYDFKGVWGGSGNDVFVVGGAEDYWPYEGVILHFDGGAWSEMSRGVFHGLNDIWGGSGDDVFAVSEKGEIVHYSGAGWTKMSVPPDVGDRPLYCVWGRSGDDVFIGGENGVILHYNGAVWEDIFCPGNDEECIIAYGRSDFIGMGGGPDGKVFATAPQMGIFCYEGGAWTSMTGGSSGNLYGVSANTSGDAYVVGEFGKILRFVDNDWSEASAGSRNHLQDVWGGSGSDVFAVGWSGTILHYDGLGWTEMATPAGVNDYTLTGVWGRSGNDVFATGRASFSGTPTGIILHYDGVAWSKHLEGAPSTLEDVWGGSGGDVFAVGRDVILHYDGESWTEMTRPASDVSLGLFGVWGSSGRDVFAVGEDVILHYDGVNWTEMTLPPKYGAFRNLSDVWGRSGDDVFAVGWSVILHYDGVSWSTMTGDEPEHLSGGGLWGGADGAVFATGGSGSIFYLTGMGWGVNTIRTGHSLNGVWGDSAGTLFAVGQGGAILTTRDYIPAAPEAPILNVTTRGTKCALSWDHVYNAMGYHLYFAPYPGASYIGSIDMGNRSGFSANLSSGAAYWVALQAYNNAGPGDLSNIEFFIIE